MFNTVYDRTHFILLPIGRGKRQVHLTAQLFILSSNIQGQRLRIISVNFLNSILSALLTSCPYSFSDRQLMVVTGGRKLHPSGVCLNLIVVNTRQLCDRMVVFVSMKRWIFTSRIYGRSNVFRSVYACVCQSVCLSVQVITFNQLT